MSEQEPTLKEIRYEISRAWDHIKQAHLLVMVLQSNEEKGGK
jgi:hypothetical protein